MSSIDSNTKINYFDAYFGAPEVKQHIFAQLDKETLGKVAQVCKDWLAQTPAVWKAIYLRDWPTELPSSEQDDLDWKALYRQQRQQRIIDSNIRSGNAVVTDFKIPGANNFHYVNAGKLICTMGDYNKIHVFDSETGWSLKKINTIIGVVECVALGAGKLFASGEDDGIIHVWDEETGLHQTFVGHQDTVTAFCVSGGNLFSGSFLDDTLRIWDIMTGQCHQILDGTVDALCVSEGKLFYGSSDNVIRVWDIEKKDRCLPFNGHTGKITALCVSEGKLFSGSEDGTIRIWDIETGLVLQTLPAVHHQAFPTSLCISAGKLFAGSSSSGIYIWDIKTRGSSSSY